MKKLIIIAIAGVSLAGCANYQANLNTFTANAVATNQAIAQVSASLAKNCNDIEATAKSIAALTSVFTTNTTANGSLAAANAAISTYCQNPPTDIAGAVRVTAAQAIAARAAYQMVKDGK